MWFILWKSEKKTTRSCYWDTFEESSHIHQSFVWKEDSLCTVELCVRLGLRYATETTVILMKEKIPRQTNYFLYRVTFRYIFIYFKSSSNVSRGETSFDIHLGYIKKRFISYHSLALSTQFSLKETLLEYLIDWFVCCCWISSHSHEHFLCSLQF